MSASLQVWARFENARNGMSVDGKDLKKRPICWKYWIWALAVEGSIINTCFLSQRSTARFWKSALSWAAYPHDNILRLSTFFVKITHRPEILVILNGANDSKALQPHPVYGGIFTRVIARATTTPSTIALALWDCLSQDGHGKRERVCEYGRITRE